MGHERGVELERRLTDLEIRYTHQEETIRQLSDVVYQQERALEALSTRLAECEKAALGGPVDGG